MVGLDVGEHGGLAPTYRMALTLAAKVNEGPRPTREALQDQVQRRGPRADRDGMGDPRLFRDAMLELLDPGTERQAPGAQDLGQGSSDTSATGRRGALRCTPATPCGCSV